MTISQDHELVRCLHAEYDSILEFLKKEFPGERFEVALKADSLGSFWEVYDAETGLVQLCNRAPAAIWELKDGSWAMVSNDLVIGV